MAQADEYQLMDMAVSDGVTAAVNYAFEGSDRAPLTDAEKEQLAEVLYREVMGSICNWFQFDTVVPQQ